MIYTKKTFIIFLIVFLLCGCGKENKVTENKVLQNVVESEQEKEIEENNKNVDVQEQVEEKNETDSDTNEKVESKDTNNKNNMNTNNNTNTNKQETNTNASENVESNVEVKKEEETNTKHTCTDADSGFVIWKNNYLKTNNTSRLYDSFDIAYAAGYEIASKYSYGYIVDKSPSRYSDDTCTKEVYILEIYVPQGICENNPMLYVPNNINIEGQHLTSVGYLKQLGYECVGKS